jgi:large subunit ribosomal protein L44e
MKAPKSIRTYCPRCRKHTSHTVAIYRKHRERVLSEGRRRYNRKLRGYGGQPRPIQRRPAKTTKKISIQLSCKDCGYVLQRSGIRLGKMEITA